MTQRLTTTTATRVVRSSLDRKAEMGAGETALTLQRVAREALLKRHAAASCWGRYASMKLRTFCSVSGQTRRPLSSWCTKGLSFSANSPKREALIS